MTLKKPHADCVVFRGRWKIMEVTFPTIFIIINWWLLCVAFQVGKTKPPILSNFNLIVDYNSKHLPRYCWSTTHIHLWGRSKRNSSFIELFFCEKVKKQFHSRGLFRRHVIPNGLQCTILVLFNKYVSAPELYKYLFDDNLFSITQYTQFYTTAANRHPNIFSASVTYNLLFQLSSKFDALC